VAEQSHKREMSDAVRGDFERLRARRQRRPRAAERPAGQSERIVLTPPQPAQEPEPPPVAVTPAPMPVAVPAEPPAPERPSRLRALFRRG
jgi:hypothetical protein